MESNSSNGKDIHNWIQLVRFCDKYTGAGALHPWGFRGNLRLTSEPRQQQEKRGFPL